MKRKKTRLYLLRYSLTESQAVVPWKILERIARSKYNRVTVEFYLFLEKGKISIKSKGKRKRVRKSVMQGEYISIPHICRTQQKPVWCSLHGCVLLSKCYLQLILIMGKNNLSINFLTKILKSFAFVFA